MGRILATLGILVLLMIPLLGPQLPGVKQGFEPGKLRSDDPDAVGRVGETLPDFELVDLQGVSVRLSDFRGHRVLLTFERSLDW
jgi:hypothetical protein